jgi:hypothetical protein
MLFNYEEALQSKDFGKKDLPESTQNKIREFNGLCRKLNATNEEDYELQTQLNTQIEELDEVLVNEVNSYTPEPPATDPPATDPPATDPATDPPADKEGGITGGQILGFGIFAVIVGFAVKKLMGK